MSVLHFPQAKSLTTIDNKVIVLFLLPFVKDPPTCFKNLIELCKSTGAFCSVRILNAAIQGLIPGSPFSSHRHSPETRSGPS